MELGNYRLTIQLERPDLFSEIDLLIVTAAIYGLSGELSYLLKENQSQRKSLYLKASPDSVVEAQLNLGRSGYRITKLQEILTCLDRKKAKSYNLIFSNYDSQRKLIAYSSILIRTMLGGL